MKLTADDKRQIEELLIRYTYLLDLESTPREEFLSLFTDDAILVSPIRGRFVGRHGLETFADYEANASWGKSRTEQLRHITTNFLIEGAGDTASMKAYVVLYITRLDTPDRKTDFSLAGHYECDVVRVGGSWKLKSRILFLDTVSGGQRDMSDRVFDEVENQPVEGLRHG
jgi:hypothetical protein